MKEKFEDRVLRGPIRVTCKFDDGTVRIWATTKEDVVSRIIHIVNEYRKLGYRLTLRQLHYQFVSNNWIVNHDTAYKKLGSILDDCRYSGMIDWDAIEDRGRRPNLPYWVHGVEHAMDDTIEQYRRDLQTGQENAVELWTEKDALSGILSRSTHKYHIQLVVNKGYTSSSAIYTAYERAITAFKNNQRFTILYFGDHDPSGLDMIRDIEDRMTTFLSKGRLQHEGWFIDRVQKWWEEGSLDVYELVREGYAEENIMDRLMEGGDPDDYAVYEAGRIKMYMQEHRLFQVIPIGLTMEQIKQYNLPENPAKITDSRAAKYIAKFGRKSWEVDALKPQILTRIVEEWIEREIDMDKYEAMLEDQAEDVKRLEALRDKLKDDE